MPSYRARCDNAVKLRAAFTRLRDVLDTEAGFQSVFRYFYGFALSATPQRRSVDCATAVAMLRVMFDGRWAHLDAFITFLEVRVRTVSAPRGWGGANAVPSP